MLKHIALTAPSNSHTATTSFHRQWIFYAGYPRYHTKVLYDVGFFVLVSLEGAEGNVKEDLWIGKIVETIFADTENFVHRLKVHWFDVHADCT